MATPAKIINSFTAGPSDRSRAVTALPNAGAEFSKAVKTPINAAWMAGAAAAMIAAAAAIPAAIAVIPAAIVGPASATTDTNVVNIATRIMIAPMMPITTRPSTPIATARAIRPGAAPMARYPAAIRMPSPTPIAKRPLLRASQLRPDTLLRALANRFRANASIVNEAIPIKAPSAAYATATMAETTSISLPIELRISPQLWSAICTIAPTAMFIAIAVKIKDPAPTMAVAGIRFAMATSNRITADNPTIPWNSLFMSM